jgi:hypothetical protein
MSARRGAWALVLATPSAWRGPFATSRWRGPAASRVSRSHSQAALPDDTDLPEAVVDVDDQANFRRKHLGHGLLSDSWEEISLTGLGVETGGLGLVEQLLVGVVLASLGFLGLVLAQPEQRAPLQTAIPTLSCSSSPRARWTTARPLPPAEAIAEYTNQIRISGRTSPLRPHS